MRVGEVFRSRGTSYIKECWSISGRNDCRMLTVVGGGWAVKKWAMQGGKKGKTLGWGV